MGVVTKRAFFANPEEFRKLVGVDKLVVLHDTDGEGKGFIKKYQNPLHGKKVVKVKEVPAAVEPEAEPADLTDAYFDELTSIKGIGNKTAEDITAAYPDKESLIKAIVDKEKLPFDDDVERKLKKKFKVST